MKSNLLNKLISSVVQEQKMVLIILIVLIIISCLYYVITTNRKEGYDDKEEDVDFEKPDFNTLVNRAEYNNLSNDDKVRLHAHYRTKYDLLYGRDPKIRIQLNGYIGYLDILRQPFYKIEPTREQEKKYAEEKTAKAQDDLQYQPSDSFTPPNDTSTNYWLDTTKFGIHQFFQFQYQFDTAMQPSKLLSKNNYGNLFTLTGKTFGPIQYFGRRIKCDEGVSFLKYTTYRACASPTLSMFMLTNIIDVLKKFYDYKPSIVDRSYQIIVPPDPEQYGGEEVSLGGFIYALQQFLFSWKKFRVLYWSWLENPANKRKYLKTIYIFNQVEKQAFQQNTDALLKKPLKTLKNIYTVAREEDTINYMGTKSDNIADVVKQSKDKSSKPIDFIEEEFEDVLRQFLYLGMTFSDIVPTRETDDYAKISDKITTALNMSQHEKALIDIFGDLSAPELKNDITYAFVNEKANDVTNEFNKKWKELDDAFTYTINKMYFVYPPIEL